MMHGGLRCFSTAEQKCDVRNRRRGVTNSVCSVSADLGHQIFAGTIAFLM